MSKKIQCCHQCGNETGRCEDDAIFAGYDRCSIGPLCEDCYDDIRRGVIESDSTLSAARELLDAVAMFIEFAEEPPDRNCSCHIDPPCGDCVEYGGIRKAFELGRAAILKNKKDSEHAETYHT